MFDSWAKSSLTDNIAPAQISSIIERHTKELRDYAEEAVDAAYINDLPNIIEHCIFLLNSYKYKKMNINIYLFKAKDLLSRYVSVDCHYNYWDQYTNKKVETVMVNGTHETLLEEQNISMHAPRLAEILTAESSNKII